MSDPARIDDYDVNKRYTYNDYLKWDTKERYQLINGEVYAMASPSVTHQALLMGLALNFGNWLEGKPCKVFAAPLDVRLFPKRDRSDNTIVQPDLLVVCDKSKIDKRSINGAPDLVIEIISPSNSHSELFLKFQYYLKAGVKEYWVVDPESKKASVYILENGYYTNKVFENNDTIPVTILDGLNISLKDLWARIPESTTSS